MSKKLPNLQSVVRLIQSASLYTGGALLDQNHQSYPIPCPGAEGLMAAFLYCTAAIVKPREGILLKPPRYIAFFNTETGAFEELKLFSPQEWGLPPVEEEWLGSYLTPAERLSAEFLTKQIRLYQAYDLLMVPFASGQTSISDNERRSAIGFKTLFIEISEKPLLPYYQTIGNQFFAWLDLVSK